MKQIYDLNYGTNSEINPQKINRNKEKRAYLIKLYESRFPNAPKYDYTQFTIDQLEIAAEYGSPFALAKTKYVDQRNIIETDKGIHDGTEILSRKYIDYNNVRTANKLGGYRMKKRVQYTLNDDTLEERKENRIEEILDKLPKEYNSIVDTIKYRDLDKLVDLCLNKYVSSIKRYLIPLIVKRARDDNKYFTTKKVKHDLGFAGKTFYIQHKTDLVDNDFFKNISSNYDTTAIIAKGHDYLFNLRNSKIGSNIDDKQMHQLQLALEIGVEELYDLLKHYRDQAGALVMVFAKQIFPNQTVKSLACAIEKDNIDHAIYLANVYRRMNTIGRTDKIDIYNLLEQSNNELENCNDEIAPVEVVSLKSTKTNKTIKPEGDKMQKQRNNKLLLSTQPEILRYLLRIIPENSYWITTLEKSELYSNPKGIRHYKYQIKDSFYNQFRDKQISIINLDKEDHSIESISSVIGNIRKQDPDTQIIIDDLRDIIKTDVETDVFDQSLEEVLLEYSSILAETLLNLDNNVPDELRIAVERIMKVDQKRRMLEYMRDFKKQYCKDLETYLRIKNSEKTRSEKLNKIIWKYNPYLPDYKIDILRMWLDSTNIIVGCSLSYATYWEEDGFRINKSWNTKFERMVDEFILNLYPNILPLSYNANSKNYVQELPLK